MTFVAELERKAFCSIPIEGRLSSRPQSTQPVGIDLDPAISKMVDLVVGSGSRLVEVLDINWPNSIRNLKN